MDINNYDDIFEYINEVFNYYNGVINTTNPAMLKVSMIVDPNEYRAAHTSYPGVIIMYPQIIKRYNPDETMFKIMIVETIIHELYHVDQFIRYSMIATNAEYVKLIEYDVEFMVRSYMINHKNQIQSLFNINCINFDSDFLSQYYHPSMYERVSIFDHFCLAIDAITMDKQKSDYIIKKMISACDVDNSRIILNINGNKFYIKNQNQYCDIRTFNSYVYDNFFKYTKHTILCRLEQNNDDVCINVQTKHNYNALVRIYN